MVNWWDDPRYAAPKPQSRTGLTGLATLTPPESPSPTRASSYSAPDFDALSPPTDDELNQYFASLPPAPRPSALPVAPPAPEPRGFLGRTLDTASGVASGVVKGLAGIGPAFYTLADVATGGTLDEGRRRTQAGLQNTLAGLTGDENLRTRPEDITPFAVGAQQASETLAAPLQTAGLQQQEARLKGRPLDWSYVKDVLTTPELLGSMAGESLPYMLPVMAPARAAQTAALARGMAPAAATKLGERVAIGMNLPVSGGTSALGIQQQIYTMPDEQFAQTFPGMTRDEAAQSAGLKTAAISGGLGLGASMLMKGGAEGALLRALGGQGVAQSIPQAFLRGAASEAGEEFLQSGGEQVGENVGLRQPLLEGVPQSAVLGGALGALTGGVFGAGGTFLEQGARNTQADQQLAGLDPFRAALPTATDDDLASTLVALARLEQSGSLTPDLQQRLADAQADIGMELMRREQVATTPQPEQSAPPGVPEFTRERLHEMAQQLELQNRQRILLDQEAALRARVNADAQQRLPTPPTRENLAAEVAALNQQPPLSATPVAPEAAGLAPSPEATTPEADSGLTSSLPSVSPLASGIPLSTLPEPTTIPPAISPSLFAPQGPAANLAQPELPAGFGEQELSRLLGPAPTLPTFPVPRETEVPADLLTREARPGLGATAPFTATGQLPQPGVPTNAQQVPLAETLNGSRSPQSPIRQEGGRPSESGPGVQPGRPESEKAGEITELAITQPDLFPTVERLPEQSLESLRVVKQRLDTWLERYGDTGALAQTGNGVGRTLIPWRNTEFVQRYQPALMEALDAAEATARSIPASSSLPSPPSPARQRHEAALDQRIAELGELKAGISARLKALSDQAKARLAAGETKEAIRQELEPAFNEGKQHLQWLKDEGFAARTAGGGSVQPGVIGSQLTPVPEALRAYVAPKPETPSTEIKAPQYPNRKIKLDKARTDFSDEFNENAWANVALANMKVGETIKAGNKRGAVKQITDNRITIAWQEGNQTKNIIYFPGSKNWESLVRDLGVSLAQSASDRNSPMRLSQISGQSEEDASGQAFDALLRDPAFRFDPQERSYRLSDSFAAPAPQGAQPAAEQTTAAPAVDYDQDEAKLIALGYKVYKGKIRSENGERRLFDQGWRPYILDAEGRPVLHELGIWAKAPSSAKRPVRPVEAVEPTAAAPTVPATVETPIGPAKARPAGPGVTAIELPVGAATPAPARARAEDYGKANKIFTEDAAAKARELLKRKLGQLNAGLDPEIVQAGITLAGYHIEAGARAFADYARAMINDLGEAARPFLRSWYEGARYYPGFDAEGMSTAEAIAALETAQKATPAETHAATTEPVETAEAPTSEWTAGARRLAESIKTFLLDEPGPLTPKRLWAMADTAFGGTQAEGRYNSKDAYDAMELGLNRAVLESREPSLRGTDSEAMRAALGYLETLQNRLPTQTRRDAEQQQMQQFSTPQLHSHVVAWVAAIQPTDQVLEPTAGTGNLVTHAKLASPAAIFANELSERRDALLRQIPGVRVFNENANHLHAILPAEVRPTVVVMNPPFSADVNLPGKKKLEVGALHIEQALQRLQPDGRLVAIVGRGMAMDAPRFSAWWKDIEKRYNVRANIAISGREYTKFGTSFDNRILVIDKNGQTGLRSKIIGGEVEKVADLIPLLEGVRGERTRPAQPTSVVATGQAGVAGSERETGTGTPVSPATGGGRGQQARPGADAQGRPRRPQGGDGPADGRAPGQRVEDADHARPGQRGRAATPRTGTESAGYGGVVGENATPWPAGAPNLAQPNTPLELEAREQGAAPPLDAQGLGISRFESYQPKNSIKGAQPHPTPLVESAAMASVSFPPLTYLPNLPPAVVASGRLSAAQLETISYAGQAHTQLLPNGERRGFFIGDGTGVGKGAQIAGILLDNWNQGRKKAVWISENVRLLDDARRDAEWVGLGQERILFQGDLKGSITLPEGVLFTTYKTLTSGEKETKGQQGLQRIDQLANWLGADFEGVIAFDEAHNMANLKPKQGAMGQASGSKTASFGVELQRRLPKARIVYVSATGATEIDNLAYTERLGLWGEGTAFSDRDTFMSAIESGGLAAMEVVAKDLKSMGLYTARSLSYDGVDVEMLNHALTPEQAAMYDTLARTWQGVLADVDHAMVAANSKQNADARKRALSAFWGSHQRFFNSVLTSLSVPSLINDAEVELQANHSIVMQLVNTNEATQERRMAQAAEAGQDLEDIDLSPRDVLMQYVQNSFPTTLYEEYQDEEGNRKTRPVFDSAGNAVQDPLAVAMRDKLLIELATLQVPEGVLEQVINHFGSDAVAEITMRKRRLVRQKDGSVVEEKLSPASRKQDAQAFDDGKKRILIFSYAGGTGRSYHADLRYLNQQRRVHYLVQPGWRADKAIQGLGRTHRTNQAQPPLVKPITTELKAQRRFISSIARRMDQMGAITRGQRDANTKGLFDEDANLENQYSQEALFNLFMNIAKGKAEGITVADIEKQIGITLLDNDGNLVLKKIPTIQQFLNRLLSLEIPMMDRVFEAFDRGRRNLIEYAKQTGTYDTGMETLIAESLIKQDDQVAMTHPFGASTHYIKIEATHPTTIVPFNELQANGKPFYARNRKSGRLYAFFETNISRTDEKTGAIISPVLRQSPSERKYFDRRDITGENYEKIEFATPAEEKAAWEQALADAPKFRKETLHLLTGALLPVWDRLPQGTARVVRAQTDAGERLLGRVIPNKEINETLRRLGVGVTAPKLTGQQALDALLNDRVTLVLANDWRLVSRTVNGQSRIEVLPPAGTKQLTLADRALLESMGGFSEMIAWNYRVFLPTDQPALLDRLIASKPIVEMLESGQTPSPSSQRFAIAATPATLIDALNALAGHREVQALLDAGRLQIVARQRNLPASIVVPPGQRVGGAIDPKTGKIVLIAENIAPDEVANFVEHEKVHGLRLGLDAPRAGAMNLARFVTKAVGLRGILGEITFNDVLAQVGRMRASGHTAINAAYQEATAAMGVLKQNPALANEETLAYFLQDPANRNLPLFRRIMAAIRAFLTRAGFKLNLTADDLVALAQTALRSQAMQPAGRLTPAFAMAQTAPRNSTADELLARIQSGEVSELTPDEWAQVQRAFLGQAATVATGVNAPTFKAWFGQSKIVKRDGTPLVMYHGTPTSFTAFNAAKSGTNTTHPTAALGFFFTNAKGHAAAKYGANVMETYLAIKKPYAMTDADLRRIESLDDAQAFRTRLEAQGYDGIVMPAETGTRYVAAFRPDQIKFTNNTSYTRGQTDMRFAQAWNETPHDAEYLAAVKRGDLATAQRMVDEAAREAGYDIGPVYHGTVDGKWTVFKNKTTTSVFGKEGYFFSFMREVAEQHARKAMIEKGKQGNGRIITAYLRNPESIGPNRLTNGVVEYVVNNADQIKSADSVTRDDAGNIIPLSQRFDQTQRDIRFAIAPGTPPQMTPPPMTRIEGMRRAIQDRFLRFKTVQDWLKQRGINLTPDADVYGEEERSVKRFAAQAQDFRDKTLTPLVQAAGKAGYAVTGGDFIAALMDGQPLPASFKPSIPEYLIAQHAAERNRAIAKINPIYPDGGSGLTDAEAETILARYRALPHFAAFERMAGQFRAIAEGTKQMLLNAGILNDETVAAWDAAYQNYVPLKGGPDDTPAKQGTGPGNSVIARQRRAMGHDLRDENVLENIFRDRERALFNIEKNKVGKALIKLMRQANNPAIGTVGQPEKHATLIQGWLHEVWIDGRPLGAYQSYNDAKAAIAADSAATGRRVAQYGVRHKAVDPGVRYLSRPLLAENEAGVYIDGQLVRVQLNDEGLARAYNALGVDGAGSLLKFAREYNTLLSKAYTGYNPEFLLVNMIRDLTAGTINLMGRYGTGFATKALKHYVGSFREAWRFARDKGNHAWLDRYRKAGGSTGASYLSDLERLGGDINRTFEDAQGAIATWKSGKPGAAARVLSADVVRKVFGLIESFNQAGENALRLATFRTVIEQGGSEAEAASAAANVTVNFNRRGEMTYPLGALYLFFNPNVQGTQILLDTLLNSPHKRQAQAAAAGLVGLAFLLANLARGGDDEDEERWRRIPDYTKDRNLILQLGEKQVIVPLPYGYGMFWAMGNVLSDLAHGSDDGKVGVRLASALFEHFSPLGNPLLGETADIKNLAELMPTLLRMPTDIMINRGGMGAPIMPEVMPWNPGQPDSARKWRETTGKLMDQVTTGLNRLSGGSPYESGAIDVSPDSIKYLWRGLTGGAGQFISDTFGLGLTLTQGVAPELRETPGLRKFVRVETVQNARTVFADQANQIRNAVGAFNAAKRAQDTAGMFDIARDRAALLRLGNVLDQFQGLIKTRRQLHDLMQSSEMPLPQKRLSLKAIEQEEIKLYGLFSQVFRKNLH